jgi:large subunit ribosomal protein L9
MKILMKKDLRKVGMKGEIVDVSDGYGANFLIPQGYGVLYTDAAQKDFEREKEAQRIEEEKAVQAAMLLAKRLETLTLKFEASAGRRGEMIGTISFKQIVETLKKQYDIILDKKQIVEKDVLVNGFGVTSLKVELAKGVFGVIKVRVDLKEKK